jgi:quinol monooxygenase YgiN
MHAKYGFHARVTAAPGKGDELVDYLLAAAAGEGPGTSEDCVLFLVGRSASDRDVIFVTEGWTSQEAHQRFFATDAAKAVLERIQSMTIGEAVYADEIPLGGKFPRR